MKVLFVNPSRAGPGNIPINIPLLISILKKRGHETGLFDFSDYAEFDEISKMHESIFFKQTQYDQENIISERKAYYETAGQPVPIGTELKTTDYIADFESLLNNFKPELIAVSCMSTDFRFATDFLLKFKKKHQAKIIFGGIHAQLMPDEVITSEICDFVCIGEGENCLPNMLDALEADTTLKGIKGIWYKEAGTVIKNDAELLTDLATLPAPDYDCFDPVHFYRPFDGKRYKMLNYEFNRGCPYSCSYCVNDALRKNQVGLGRYHRIKTIEQSITELKTLIKKHGFDFIRYWDQDFTAINEKVLTSYAEAYIKEINLPFIIYSRVESINERKIEILKRMGCKTFAIGIESGNEYIRNEILNRRMSNEAIINKFELVKSYGIRVSAYNIIGLPKETRETIFDTIELNRQVSPDSFSATILEPYRGTPIRTLCEQEGLDPFHDTVYNRKPQFIPRGLSYEELSGLYRTFPFYVKFPKDRYPDIALAETDDEQYSKLLREFQEINQSN
jgi:radical SAM superfamily enzyme YgiQ (UPF0313 family)